MSKTLLRKINIKSFRALKDIEIAFGTDITILCGKNGTAKSSILGIAAQIFSFDKDYQTNRKLSFKTITGDSYKSQFSDHFKVSPKFDTPGSMSIGVTLFDAYSKQDATGELTLTTRESKFGMSPRVVVRNNSTAEFGSNKDRNFTHPVIYLSLKRLYPIAFREKYLENTFPYFDDDSNVERFIGLTNELLGKQATKMTGTSGTLSSIVSHGTNYDFNSVSAGEDNAGQLVTAIMSFDKLKKEYGPEYNGGLLLIDEADAGLFPAAQQNLINILDRKCKELKLQVIMTSHATTMIERVYDEGLKSFNRTRYKTVYLTDTYGQIEVRDDWDWNRIYADIHIKTVKSGAARLPRVNVYFEDKEGYDFFSALMRRRPVRKYLSPLHDVTLGCTNYIQLVKNARIPEFRDKSVICLDADAIRLSRNLGAIVILPGHLPPDQLLFEYLYNISASDDFWHNEIGYTRPVFLADCTEIIRELSITGNTVDLPKILLGYKGSHKPRELFKSFYKKNNFQQLLQIRSKSNPWVHWINTHEEERNIFISQIIARVKSIMRNVHGVEAGKLSALDG